MAQDVLGPSQPLRIWEVFGPSQPLRLQGVFGHSHSPRTWIGLWTSQSLRLRFSQGLRPCQSQEAIPWPVLSTSGSRCFFFLVALHGRRGGSAVFVASWTVAVVWGAAAAAIRRVGTAGDALEAVTWGCETQETAGRASTHAYVPCRANGSDFGVSEAVDGPLKAGWNWEVDGKALEAAAKGSGVAGKAFQVVGRCARVADTPLGAQKVAAKIMRSLEGALRSFEEVLRSLEEPLRSLEEALHSPEGVISDLVEPP